MIAQRSANFTWSSRSLGRRRRRRAASRARILNVYSPNSSSAHHFHAFAGAANRWRSFPASRPGSRRHDEDTIGEKHRFLNAVGHEQHGFLALFPDAQELQIELVARHRVERAERLVHQQQLRIGHQGAAQRNALLHAAGKLVRIHLFETFQARPA